MVRNEALKPNEKTAPADVRQRKIIHVDMDAFFASVEQRDNEDLRGKPVAVGGTRERGVVAAASYEARKYGVHSAMASVTARRICPDLVFVKPRFDVYREISMQIRAIFRDYTPLVEPMSLDEAYLDVSENLKGLPYATQVAKEVRARILAETRLTASAGVSYNKFLAKMASDQRKPNGMFVITPEQGADFVETLPIRKFHGIGPRTADRMGQLGIMTGKDLRARSLEFLTEHFGKSGRHYYDISRGVDLRDVCPNRVRKSIGAENTFAFDLSALDEMKAELVPIIEKVWAHCERTDVRGRTITLKVKFDDFRQITRSRTVQGEFDSREAMTDVVTDILEGLYPMERGVRLLGVSVSGFDTDSDPQMALAL